MSLVVPLASLFELAELQTAFSLWVNPALHLFTNNITPSPASALADFVEASFVGYAAGSLTGGPEPPPNLNGDVVSDLGVASYDATGAGLPATCFGVYLTDQASAVLLAAARFSDQMVFNDIADLFQVVFKFGLNWQAADSAGSDLAPDAKTRFEFGALLFGGTAVIL